MKPKTKSSITLSPAELAIVEALQTELGLKTEVEVIRRGLDLLKNAADRSNLRTAYRRASAATRGTLATEIRELDHLAAEGLDEA